MKENYQKTLKKSTLFFLQNPVPFNGQGYQKQTGYETSDQSLYRLWNKFRKILLLVIYYPTKFDDVIQSDFWGIPKTTSANLCMLIYDIINYSTSTCPSVSEIVEREKITKIRISQERKELYRWNEKHFS